MLTSLTLEVVTQLLQEIFVRKLSFKVELRPEMNRILRESSTHRDCDQAYRLADDLIIHLILLVS